MTDAPIAIPSNRPEYTAEQVDSAKIDLAAWLTMFPKTPLAKVSRILLSALSTAESEIAQCRETLRLKPSESLPHAITSMKAHLASAREDAAVDVDEVAFQLWWRWGADGLTSVPTYRIDWDKRPDDWKQYWKILASAIIDAAMTKERE